MARSFSNVKVVSVFVANEISAVLTRRGYAAVASQQGTAVSRSGSKNPMMLAKASVEDPKKNTTSWVPDPVTGYYRPENKAAKEVDAAELREMLIVKNRNRGSH